MLIHPKQTLGQALIRAIPVADDSDAALRIKNWRNPDFVKVGADEAVPANCAQPFNPAPTPPTPSRNHTSTEHRRLCHRLLL